MARITGRHGRVEITDASPAVILGSISQWTLSQARDYVEVTAFEDTNKVYVPGLRDISGTIAFFYSMDAGSPAAGDTEALFEAAESDDPVTLRLTPDSLDTLRSWTGPAYVDVSAFTVDVKGAVSGTANFKASGAWTRA
jgi:hypothetical protein